MRLLVVEDDPRLSEVLVRGLREEHYAVDAVRDGQSALYQLAISNYDGVVLDVMIPPPNGFEVCRQMRASRLATPVLMLTARDAVDDRIHGLDSGADDYLVKPFAFEELLARIRALLRRGRPDQVLRLTAADLEMDLISRRVTRGSRPIELTSREFDLLEYLLRHHQQLVSREMLARDVWKEPSRATPLDNVIDVHIAHLRKKVDQDAPTKLIHTVRGVGFVLRDGEP